MEVRLAFGAGFLVLALVVLIILRGAKIKAAI